MTLSFNGQNVCVVSNVDLHGEDCTFTIPAGVRLAAGATGYSLCDDAGRLRPISIVAVEGVPGKIKLVTAKVSARG